MAGALLRIRQPPPDFDDVADDARAVLSFAAMVTPKGPRAASLVKVSNERARLARAQAELAEQKLARQRGALLDSDAVEREWSDVLRGVRAGMLAVPSRVAQRLPHLTAHDVAEIDSEIRAALGEIGGE